MPHALKRGSLPHPRLNLSHFPQRLKKPGRLFALHQRLFHFAHHAFLRQPAQFERPADRHRLRRNREIKPRRKLRRPHCPQRVASECLLIHVSDDALSDILPPAEIIEEQIASALDLVVQQDRLSGGKRRITQVAMYGENDAHGRRGFVPIVSWDRRTQRYEWGELPSWIEDLPYMNVATEAEVRQWVQSVRCCCLAA